MIQLYQLGQHDEIGKAFLELKLEISSFEFKVFRDNQLIQDNYYDVYVKDQAVIKNHLNIIQDVLK